MNSIDCYKVINVDNKGITLEYLNSNICIYFEECAKNYAIEKSLETSKCVATRNITTLTFTFYTVPKTKIIFKKHFLKDLLLGKSAIGQFIRLQNAISQAGYTSYDLS